MAPEPTPVLERWTRLVVQADPDVCWEWAGNHSPGGYGQFKAVLDGRLHHGAHRVAYLLFVGHIPDGWVIDHVCHNRGCVNPSHLRAVTYKQNNENRWAVNRNTSSGYRGVNWDTISRRWKVQVSHHGRLVFGGYYATPEEANEAAIALRNRLFTHNDADRAA